MDKTDGIVLDDLDWRILAELQDDAALTNHALAARVFCSPPTCLRRVRRLTALGVIQSVVALLDPAQVGQPLTTIVEVTLDVQTMEQLDAFERRAVAEPAVVQCYRVSGGPDFVVIVIAADMSAYHALVARLFNAAANVRNVRSFFSVHRAKFETRVVPPERLPGSGGTRA
ncbi:Lrp/AsnC family transcriptional regulator [Achromobacter sp. GG226]|uniref:Lrp/AsnC family transcriptional regulator n=1 Tax=Verticiella alkaliphila TaxID=2779529 RepID=UPI001C0C349F|nr:Lrp/AsnC family transcriptional regulator [Verticiella sp. GG226]MBU4610929.1 Lrp/AsnC family transcriptional regulator [Verticiella sp. GG226]